MVEADTVVNRYRVVLGAALPAAGHRAAEAKAAFAVVRQAMAGGAWDSPVAVAFVRACVEKEAFAGVAADDCVADLDRRHRVEPVRVEVADRRARFFEGRG